MKQALIIIDIQNDYFKNGKMELLNPQKALIHVNKLEKTLGLENYRLFISNI